MNLSKLSISDDFKNILFLIFIVGLAVWLSGCSSPQNDWGAAQQAQVGAATAPAPQVVYQQDDGMSPVTAGLLGAAAGYMLSGSNNTSNYQRNNVTVVEHRVVQAPAPTPAPQYLPKNPTPPSMTPRGPKPTPPTPPTIPPKPPAPQASSSFNWGQTNRASSSYRSSSSSSRSSSSSSTRRR